MHHGFVKCNSRIFLLALIATLSVSFVWAAMLAGSYKIPVSMSVNAGANTASAGYRIQTGTLGQGFASAQSSSYRNAGGFVYQTVVEAAPLPNDLREVYVYPSPFKPNSPGRFQADKLTFKRLPAEAVIRIFTIAGKQIAELHKTNGGVDYYEWSPVNDDGQRLASGVYVYLITSPDKSKVKGKFAIIR